VHKRKLYKLILAVQFFAALYILIPTFHTMAEESNSKHPPGIDTNNIDWKSKPEEYWREVLTPEQFTIARKGGTERPFTGQYYHFDKKGNYTCSSCGQILFSSDTKFDSGSGWPSFSEVANSNAVKLIEDHSHGMMRTEVRCSRCDAHLGHVFDDGPGPNGKRYCINSASLKHIEEFSRPEK
jgi:peptide-methionine (R)-S-oxide reductase